VRIVTFGRLLPQLGIRMDLKVVPSDVLTAWNFRCSLLSELEGKAAALKNATQMIHDEVSEHNKYLNGMVRFCIR
jgi:hypothetical protein